MDHDRHGHEQHGHEPSSKTSDVAEERIHELNHAGHTSHDMQEGHGSGDHAGHDKHAGHSVAMFRDRFWLSVLLTIPILVWSEMVQDWLGYTAPSFPLSGRIPAILGTVIFVYGGMPFLKGGVQELRDRQPGMMLLISLAIVVAFVASLASEFDWLDLEFWWELALLIDEVDALGPCSERVNERLRGILMEAFSQNLVVVLSGVKVEEGRPGEVGPRNGFLDEIEIPAFTREEAEALVKAPVADVFRYEAEAVERVLELSGLRPYLIQKLCIHSVNRMLEVGRTTVRVKDVEAARERLHR